MPFFGSNKPPARFNNMPTIQRVHSQDVFIIQGRILPKREPYCRASFLIEITLPREYPFKTPGIIFLDPIYHPNVDERGCHYCCFEHLLGNETWKPTTPLTALVEATIRTIDNISDSDQSVNHERTVEYRNDSQKFFKKALKLTLSYGRPRY